MLYRNRLKWGLRQPQTSHSLSTSGGLDEELSSSDTSDMNRSLEGLDHEPELLSLNEIVISRSQHAQSINLDLYVNNYLITTFIGDGIQRDLVEKNKYLITILK